MSDSVSWLHLTPDWSSFCDPCEKLSGTCELDSSVLPLQIFSQQDQLLLSPVGLQLLLQPRGQVQFTTGRFWQQHEVSQEWFTSRSLLLKDSFITNFSEFEHFHFSWFTLNVYFPEQQIPSTVWWCVSTVQMCLASCWHTIIIDFCLFYRTYIKLQRVYCS